MLYKGLVFRFTSLTKFIFLASLILPFAAYAEITVTEVANGRAIIKFDKSDEISTNSKLVLKELSANACSPNPEADNTCPTCPVSNCESQNNFKRTHLITGSIKSGKQEETAKSNGSSVSADTTSVEIEGSYYYNFGHFALGAGYSSTRDESGGDETLSSAFSFGGRYFIIENKVKNNIIPYIGFRLVGITAELPATPKITAELSGSAFDFGANFYLNHSAFVDLRYVVGAAKGDLKQGSTSVDYEIEQSGLSVGIGIALE